MSEATGRPAGGGRSSNVRRGYEVYTPASAAAAARRAEASTSTAGATTGGDGHDTTRGRALWEDEREAARLPQGDREWKRDRWDEDDAAADPPPRGRGGAGGSARRRAEAATASEPKRG
ncbi:unnamed protein product, partial [Laminaria digitata]